MTAGKAPQALLRVMHNSLSESDSEGTYSIIALASPLVWPEICPSTGETPSLA